MLFLFFWVIGSTLFLTQNKIYIYIAPHPHLNPKQVDWRRKYHINSKINILSQNLALQNNCQN